jgi:hypothetical protein
VRRQSSTAAARTNEGGWNVFQSHLRSHHQLAGSVAFAARLRGAGFAAAVAVDDAAGLAPLALARGFSPGLALAVTGALISVAGLGSTDAGFTLAFGFAAALAGAVLVLAAAGCFVLDGAGGASAAGAFTSFAFVAWAPATLRPSPSRSAIARRLSE